MVYTKAGFVICLVHMSRGLAGKLGPLEVFVHWASIISKNNQLDDFRMSFNEPISYTK